MRGSGPQHTGIRQTAASVRQSGLRESAASDLSADYSFLNSYSILLILHQKFSLASRLFLLTDVWQPWNDLQSVLANCATAVICQIRQYKFLNVCFCDLLPFFLCFLGSCLGDVHKTFFCPSLLFSFHSGTLQSLGNGFHSDRNCRQGECAETGMWAHWHSRLLWSGGLPLSSPLIWKLSCYICFLFLSWAINSIFTWFIVYILHRWLQLNQIILLLKTFFS